MCYIGTMPVQSRGGANGTRRRAMDQRVSIYGPAVWNYTDGQRIRVVCATNQQYARLTLNGEEVGETTEKDPTTGLIWWDVPYKDGVLRAEALDGQGRVNASYEIQTTGKPAALRLTSDKTTLSGRGRVAHVIIEVVDDEDRVVSLADNEVTVRINGEGRLLGLEGGDMSDTSNLRDNRQRVVRGRLLAYVESTESVGEIVVSATSPLLGQAQLEMKVE